MKPVKKDAKRQQRREKTLARLESYLAGGVKYIGANKRENIVGRSEKFTPSDVNRLEKEIGILRNRLGIGDVYLKAIGV